MGSLHLPKRPKIPERPRNTGKTSEWLNTFAGDCGEGVGHFNLIFKNVLMSIFEYSYNKINIKIYCLVGLVYDTTNFMTNFHL